MSRKTVETAKVVLLALCTAVTGVAAWIAHNVADLPLVGFLALFTGYFVWERHIVLRERERDAPRSQVASDSACSEPNSVQRWTINVVATSLGATGLALGWAVAQFDDYSHAFVAQHGGTTTGVAIALGFRCLAVVGWASALRRFGRGIRTGGARAIWLATAWAVVTAVAYALLARQDGQTVLVTFDVIRSMLGLGLGAALLAPPVRRELASPSVRA